MFFEIPFLTPLQHLLVIRRLPGGSPRLPHACPSTPGPPAWTPRKTKTPWRQTSSTGRHGPPGEPVSAPVKYNGRRARAGIMADLLRDFFWVVFTTPPWSCQSRISRAIGASNAGSASGICEDLATGQRARGHGWRSTPFGLNLPKQRGVVGPALKNLLRPRAPGSPRVAGDQVPDAGLLDGITKSRPAHVLGVAPDRQDVRLVQYKCDAARHAGGEIPANRPQHHYDAARHVLTPVITHALHDGRGAAVAHTKTLSRSPRRKQAPAGRAIECSVSENHVVLCCTRERRRWPVMVPSGNPASPWVSATMPASPAPTVRWALRIA